MSGEKTLSARPRPKPPETASGGRPVNLQDAFLNLLRKNKSPVTMFLVKGVKLQGIVTWFDNFSILLRRDGQSQLVYKHAISTIMPAQPVDTEQFTSQGSGAKQRLLQDLPKHKNAHPVTQKAAKMRSQNILEDPQQQLVPLRQPPVLPREQLVLLRQQLVMLPR